MFLDSEINDRANQSIAQGALTNSKHPDRFIRGIYPTHIKHSYQCYLVDTRDNVFTDYICSLGTNLLGYGNHLLEANLSKVKGMGKSNSLSTVYEIEAAEMLKAAFTFTDKWKFLKTGSEACSASVKMARAKTGRKLILSDHYHGWHDEFVSLMEPANGVCGSGHIQKLSDYKGDYSDVAAVIIEPVATDFSDARRMELSKLRSDTSSRGALLIFDEIISGLRFPKLSVANYWSITPDIILLGKAMANGQALAAVGGKRDVMDGDYFVSSTFAGEVEPLVTSALVTKMLLNKNPHYDLDKLWEEGDFFIKKFNDMLEPDLWIDGYPTRGVFKYKDPMVFACFLEKAIKCNILLGPSWFYNFDLIRENYKFFEFLKTFRGYVNNGDLRIEGEMPTSPFSQKVRG